MKLVIHPAVDADRLQAIVAAAGSMQVINAASEAEAHAAIVDADAFFGKLTAPLLAAVDSPAMGAIAHGQPGTLYLSRAGRAPGRADQHAGAV